MMLLTKEIRAKLPALYSQENVADPIVQVKFFYPAGSWTWYVIEFDGQDLFFGKVFSADCPEGELGYFGLSELQSFHGRFHLGIERDRHFRPKPLNQCENPCG